MRSAVFYGVLGAFGILGSLQGCDCKDDPNTTPTPDASIALPDAGPGADGSTCLDQDPPSGFSAVSSGDGKQGDYGLHVSMTLDDKGSPMVAFVHWGPDGTGTGLDSILYFTRWDRCTATWSTPVNVAMPGAIGTDRTARQVSIARDASTGAIGIAFNHRTVVDPDNSYNEVFYAQSTDQGATWASAVVSDFYAGDEGGIHNTNGPGVAMGGGQVHIAYSQENIYCVGVTGNYCNGKYAVGTPGNWTRTILPVLEGAFGISLGAPVQIQLDSASKPGVAYLMQPNSGANTQVGYWRPGNAAVVKVTDDQGAGNDSPSLALAFEGDKPRIVSQLALPDDGIDLLYSRSNDGVTWDAPIKLPRDGDEGTGFAQAIAVGAGGKVAVVGQGNTGSGTNVCGDPKIARSTDDGATWATCGADTTKTLSGVAGRFVSAAYAPSGKLLVAFQVSENDTDPLKSGVAIWREP